MFKKPNLGSGGQGGEFVYSCLKLSRRKHLHHPRPEYRDDRNVERTRRQRLLSDLNTRNNHPVPEVGWGLHHLVDRQCSRSASSTTFPPSAYTQIEAIITMEDKQPFRCVDGADRRKVCAERNRDDDGSW